MHLKRKKYLNIQTANKSFCWLAVLFLFFGIKNLSAQQKFKIINPCTIDYSSLNTGTGGGGGSTPTADPTSIYFTSTTLIDTLANTSDWVWSLGPGNPVFRGKIVQVPFLNPGTYTVTLNRKQNNIDLPPATEQITINTGPKVPFFLSNFATRDTSLCQNFTLNPYKNQITPSYKYEWYPTGATSKTIIADVTDLYSVKVTDPSTGCYVTASIFVNICGSTPKQSIAEYHFGDGIKLVANHGNAQSATEFPVQVNFENGGNVLSGSASSSIQNPNAFSYMRYLFSTDGANVFGINGPLTSLNPADNGKSLVGNGNTALSTLIIPKVEGDSAATTQFYVLAINNLGQLSYSLIETRGKDEGDGTIIQKNIPLLENMSNRLVASAFNASTGKYYIVTHDNQGNYYTFTVSALGLSGPIKSTSPNILTNTTGGQSKFSSNNQKVVTTFPAPPENFMEVCDFDSTTGALSNCQKISLGNGPAKLYGAEFSLNDNYIYYTLNRESNADTTVKSELIRLDLSNNSKMIVDQSKTLNFGDLQATNFPGNNTEILMAIGGTNYLASIQNSNAVIPALYLTNEADTTRTVRKDLLEYQIDLYRINGAKSTLDLSNSVKLPANSSSSSDSFEAKPGCEGNALGFQASPGCDVKEVQYEWDFGDGSPTGTKQQTSHTYSKPGLYKIRLFITYCSKPPVILEDTLRVLPKAKIDLKANYENCFKFVPNFDIETNITNQSELNIPFANDLTYFWEAPITPPQNEEKDITVTAQGTYKVTLANTYILGSKPFTCESTFQTVVTDYCPPVFAVPNIFTPNGDGLNDILELKKDEIDPNTYQFRIYNRWGELVYFSETVAEPNPWNGKYKGCDLEADTFAWTVEYRSRFKPNGIIYRDQGALALVR